MTLLNTDVIAIIIALASLIFMNVFSLFKIKDLVNENSKLQDRIMKHDKVI